jgi:hypothetical protein
LCALFYDSLRHLSFREGGGDWSAESRFSDEDGRKTAIDRSSRVRDRGWE